MTDDLKLVERLRGLAPEPDDMPTTRVAMLEAASAIERLMRERDEARDYGESAGDAARAILGVLGISQDPSMEPGADPCRDRIAAIIDKSYAADRDRLAAQVAEMREAVGDLLKAPALADENHDDPSWGCAETSEAIRRARALLASTEPKA